jgi:hypothetical protein
VIAIVIFILTVLAAVGFFILAWTKWAQVDPKFRTPRWRGIVAFIGLCSLTAQGLLFVTMNAYGLYIGGWSHNYRLFNVWGRVDFYLFVVLLAAVVGNGRSRPVDVSFFSGNLWRPVHDRSITVNTARAKKCGTHGWLGP